MGPPSNLAAPVKGALWMIVSCAFLSLLAAIARHLAGEGLHPNLITFFRLLFALFAMLPWLAVAGSDGLKTDRWKLYLVRATVSTGAMFLWFWSISLVPIGEVTALSFLAPLFTTVGAALVLREKVRGRRWSATLIGFLGALVIIRPGVIEMSPGAWFAVGAAALIGTSLLIVKSLSRTENPNRVVFYMNLLMTPIALGPALWVWETPAATLWPWIVAMGPVAIFGHIAMVKAFAQADASAVVPFDFSRLPFAVLLGWLAFGETIDSWTWAGATIIFASSLYIAHREAQLNKSAPPAVGAGD